MPRKLIEHIPTTSRMSAASAPGRIIQVDPEPEADVDADDEPDAQAMTSEDTDTILDDGMGFPDD